MREAETEERKRKVVLKSFQVSSVAAAVRETLFVWSLTGKTAIAHPMQLSRT